MQSVCPKTYFQKGKEYSCLPVYQYIPINSIVVYLDKAESLHVGAHTALLLTSGCASLEKFIIENTVSDPLSETIIRFHR